MLGLGLAALKVLLFIFRWLEHRGKVNDARKAVEGDLIRLGFEIVARSRAARDSVTATDELLSDPDNRDATKESG